MKFFQTPLGRKFYDHDIPKFLRILERIAKALEKTKAEEYTVRIRWGDMQNADTYTFGTREELDAFMEGVDASCGWPEYEIVDSPNKFIYDPPELATVGAKVKALRYITENSGEPDAAAVYPASGFIHAIRGEVGEVVHVRESDNCITVRFERSGHATIVFPGEVTKA